MANVRVEADLPFPLRVNPIPYEVETEGVKWELLVERVAQSAPDRRIARAGDFDLAVDRNGQVSYSRLTGTAELDPGNVDIFVSFRGALNSFIEHVRDAPGVYWIRALESTDLYNSSILVDGEETRLWTTGRGGGVTLPVSGLTDAADERLRTAIKDGGRPPVWRLMQLDARDSLELGRNEDAVILAWCSLGAGCRQAISGLSYGRQWTIAELANALESPGRKKTPPLSFEEAVNRVSSGLKIVEVAAALAEPLIYESRSVVSSARLYPFMQQRRACQ